MPHVISSSKPFTLEDNDLQLIGCSRSELQALLNKVSSDKQLHIENAGSRLQEIGWLRKKIDSEVKAKNSLFFSEGLFALQMYLLITCVDTLGHTYCKGKPAERIRAFILELPNSDQQRLIVAFQVWMTNEAEAINQGLVDTNLQHRKLPSRAQIVHAVESRSDRERLSNISHFLFDYRNWFTHEADYPQLGMHPTLKVLHGIRLGVSTVASFGERDYTQPMIAAKDRWYFVYYEGGDPINELRRSVVRGLGKIIGSNLL